jgi:hypothetical protein
MQAQGHQAEPSRAVHNFNINKGLKFPREWVRLQYLWRVWLRRNCSCGCKRYCQAPVRLPNRVTSLLQHQEHVNRAHTIWHLSTKSSVSLLDSIAWTSRAILVLFSPQKGGCPTMCHRKNSMHFGRDFMQATHRSKLHGPSCQHLLR